MPSSRRDVAPLALAELEQDLGATRPFLVEIDKVVAGFNAEEPAARTVQPADGEGGAK